MNTTTQLNLHQNNVITWIGPFLSNRTHRVFLDGEESESCSVMSGVPQASVLRPCLFLLYINDIPGMIESNIRLFADDYDNVSHRFLNLGRPFITLL